MTKLSEYELNVDLTDVINDSQNFNVIVPDFRLVKRPPTKMR